MFSLWDDFKLGLAGVGDLLGLTSGNAARVWAGQTGEALGLEFDEIAELEELARRTQAEADVVRRAAGQTVDDLADAGVRPFVALASWLVWTLWGAAVLVVGGLAFYVLRAYGPKPKRKVLA